eukprot:3006551-Rhodomonas_salina.1
MPAKIAMRDQHLRDTQHPSFKPPTHDKADPSLCDVDARCNTPKAKARLGTGRCLSLYVLSRPRCCGEERVGDKQGSSFGGHNALSSQPKALAGLLLRLQPFTSLRGHMQVGSLHHHDRIFHSVRHLFCMAREKDALMEVSAELLLAPEVLLSRRREEETRADDVELPPWARGSAHCFLRMHTHLSFPALLRPLPT